MTLKQAIAMADLLVENTLPQELKIMWLNEAEGLVQTEIMRVHIDEVVAYTEADLEKEMLVKAPHHKIYVSYLAASYHFAHLEYDLYETTRVKFNNELKEFGRWFLNTWPKNHPKDYVNETPGTIGTLWRGWYLTAYGLAVKHGFIGDEAAWLASLKGEKGDKGEPALLRYDPDSGFLQWQNRGDDAWQDLIPIGELMDAAVADATQRAEDAAATAVASEESAAASAAAAEKSAQLAVDRASAARNSATTASDEAARAQTFATDAQTCAAAAAESAGESAACAADAAKHSGASVTASETAVSAVQAAEAAKEETLKAHADAVLLLSHAEDAAERAEAAAERAEAAGGGSGGGVNVTGATVGQIIKIAAVDENGKPTAWTAEDLPETPDVPENVVQYTEQALTEEEQMQARANLGLYYKRMEQELTKIANTMYWGHMWEAMNVPKNLSDGAHKIIMPDGISYDAECYSDEDPLTGMGGAYVGNYNLIPDTSLFGSGGVSVDCPVVWYQVTGGQGDEVKCVVADDYTAGTYTFIELYEVGGMVEVVDTIPEEYLPEGYTGIASFEQTAVSEVDGGENVFTVTMTDGSTAEFVVKNGSQGSTGPKGETGDQGPQGEKGETGETGEAGADGYTPVKGVDYFTDADKDELAAAVLAMLDDAGEVAF